MSKREYKNKGPIFLTQAKYAAKQALGEIPAGQECRITDWEAQEKLVAGSGIAIAADGKTISADVRTYKAFPSSWPHTSGTTIAQFCTAVNASYQSGEAKVGDAFLGNINSTAFFSGAHIDGGGSLGSAEVSVQIMTPFGNNCVQLLTTTSSNNSPYHWEYTYVDGAATEGWRSWTKLPDLPADASTKTYTLQAVNGTLTWV